MKNSTQSDLFWQEIINASRGQKRNKTHEIEKIVEEFANSSISFSDSATSFRQAIRHRIRQEKNRKLFAYILGIGLITIILLIGLLKLLLAGDKDFKTWLGLTTETPTPTQTFTPVPTPTPTETPTPLPTPTPIIWPDLYRLQDGEDLMNLKSHLPLWVDNAWIVPGDQADCQESELRCTYSIYEPIPIDSYIAVFYKDNPSDKRDLQLEVSTINPDQTSTIISPFIGAQILRTSGNELSQDWLFVGVYKWPAGASVQVQTIFSTVLQQDDVLIAHLTEHDATLLQGLSEQQIAGEDYSLNDVSEILGTNNVQNSDPIASENCLKGVCVVDNPLIFGNYGLHRAGTYRFLVHLPELNNSVPKISALGSDSTLTPLEVPGWYISDEYTLYEPSAYLITLTDTNEQMVIADSVLILWKDPILTK